MDLAWTGEGAPKLLEYNADTPTALIRHRGDDLHRAALEGRGLEQGLPRAALLGSWVVQGEPAGVGIREDASLITGNASRFLPHLFR